MSLLLEALKKAEKAKEEAQRRAQGENPPAAASAPQPPPSAPEPELAGAEPGVRTREQLPDIREPLQIVAEEATPRPAEPELTLADEKPRPASEPERAPAASSRTQPRPESAPPRDERAAARKVFEAKFREPNPRLPFFIALAALGLFAIGTVVYFWIQLRPPAPLVNLNPRPPAAEAQVASGALARPATSATPARQSTIPGLPTAPAVASAAPAAPAKPAPQPVARAPERPLLQPRPRIIAPEPRGPALEAEISASRPAPQVHPKVRSAYAAYRAGDLATARSDYQQALSEEPANRDALLGLAAVDVRAGRFEAAERAYLRLLQADPRDAHAQAALIALRAGRVDPVAAESRVKLMLADNPGAHVLNFTLGNQFAQQGRWAEAQQEYFKAFSAEPDNPDFAYNLAVSLDHLRQPVLAQQYYERAIALAKTRGASFNLAAAERRAAELPAVDPQRR